MGDRNHRHDAIIALSQNKYRDAGDAYTLAGYGRLSGLSDRGRELFDPEDAPWAGYALESFFLAAICYRLSDGEARARNRVGQGILIASDLRDNILETPVLAAACDEWIGTFRAIAGDDDRAATAYDRAVKGYEDADPDDPVSVTTEPLLQATESGVRQLTRPNDENVKWDNIHGSAPEQALSHRVQFFRSRVPTAIQSRINEQTLHAPRGSTEYGNDEFHCPDCGSHDVNYVADTVLCLRCDSPTERRS
jgi:hypothetical protein